MAVKIRIRRGTSAEWSNVNPVLDLGELGLETDTNKLKAGDGVTAWNALSYIAGASTASVSWGEITGTLSNQTDLQTVLNNKINTSEKGAVNGIAELDENGVLKSSQRWVIEWTDINNKPSTYPPSAHTHDDLYSPLSHNHDGVYSPTNHNHDTVYAPISHNHDGSYLKTVSEDTTPILGGNLNINGKKFVKSVSYDVVTLGSSNIDWSLGQIMSYTPTANMTFTFTNPPSSGHFTLFINQGSTGYTIGFPSTVKWLTDDGSAPDVSGANKTHVITFVYRNDTNTYIGAYMGAY
jgi:hypothetical protein